MDSRAQFEVWFNNEMYLSVEESHPVVVRLMFKAWQASREEIEILLQEGEQ